MFKRNLKLNGITLGDSVPTKSGRNCAQTDVLDYTYPELTLNRKTLCLKKNFVYIKKLPGLQ